MTVSQIDQKKLKIILTKTEIIACFGGYNALLSLNENTKQVLNLLLREIVNDYRFILGNGKINATLHLCQNQNCEIILSAKKELLSKEKVFSFSNFENLSKGITALAKNPVLAEIKGSLYKMKEDYRLIFSCPFAEPIPLKEFSKEISGNPYVSEITKEYGTPIVLKTAILNYGNAFIKEI